jgi:hypothetical protein
MTEAPQSSNVQLGPSFEIDQRLQEQSSSYNVSINPVRAENILLEAGVPKDRLHELTVFIAPRPKSRIMHWQKTLGLYNPTTLTLSVFTDRIQNDVIRSPLLAHIPENNPALERWVSQSLLSQASPILEYVFRHEAKHAGDHMNSRTAAATEFSFRRMKQISKGAKVLALISGATLLDGVFLQKHRIPSMVAGFVGLSAAMKVHSKAYWTSPHEVRARHFSKQTSEDVQSLPAISLQPNTNETIPQSSTTGQSLISRVIRKGSK